LAKDLLSILIRLLSGVSDPNDPFNNNARPNSWTPPLNQSWTWGKDRVFGYAVLSLSSHLIRADRAKIQPSVNLGGLFVLEPFISPALFQKYPGSVDEWTLSEMMAADTASGGLDQLEEHYKTFIVSKFSSMSLTLNLILVTDGARYRGDCRSWIELGQTSCSLLGRGNMAR
jgi:hypothetical protein